MGFFSQGPGRTQKPDEEEHVFTEFNTPDRWASKKIPCNDFITLDQRHNDNQDAGNDCKGVNEPVKKDVPPFHLHHPQV
jgi:hypothetical protein